MVNIFIDSISGSYGSISIPHHNRRTGNIFHDIALRITCIGSVFVLVNPFITITIERTHRTTFFSAVSIITIVETVVFLGIIIRHLRYLILIMSEINIESHTPVFVLKRNCIYTKFPTFVRHFSGVHIADLISVSITDSGRHLYFLLQHIFDVLLINIDRETKFSF